MEKHRRKRPDSWPPGPWDDEPDTALWTDEHTGLQCLADRHMSLGHWCGYVGVEPGHPAHGTCPDNVDVHGTVTFSGRIKSRWIAPLVQPTDTFWIGFDCGHDGDMVPKLIRITGEDGETYRTLDFVKAECARLARQIAAMRFDTA